MIVKGKLTLPFYVEDVIRVGYNLEPLTCKFCGSTEVVYNTLVHDGSCQTCGKWQLHPEED